MYEKFVDLYNNSNLPVTEIMSILGCDHNKFYKMYHTALDKNEITPRRNRGNPKYIHQRKKDGLWVVSKPINGKKVYFGAYTRKEMAELALILCEKVNWDIQYRWSIRNLVRELYNENPQQLRIDELIQEIRA